MAAGGREAEIRYDRARSSIGCVGQNNVIALQVAMDYVAAMRGGESRTKLPRDDARFPLGQECGEQLPGERRAIQELHGNEVDLATVCRRSVDFKNPANVVMGDSVAWHSSGVSRVRNPAFAHLIAIRFPTFSSMAS